MWVWISDKHVLLSLHVPNFVFDFQLQSKNSVPNVPVQIQMSGKHCIGLICKNFINDP
jgi:hypothetical protein